jgi:DNA polymerase (family X)
VTNEQIAESLERVAELWAGAADRFRAHAYRRAARTVRVRRTPLAEHYAEGGVATLMDLPGIGAGIARTVVELLETGHLAMLDQRGHRRCEHTLASVPGIGPILAHRVHQRLGVHTLEELDAAVHDGRLARVPGFASRRVHGVRETLAARFARRDRPAPCRPPLPVAELLDVDREYREKAARDTLVRIAPHRFNPEHRAWLPVLRTRRGAHQYTALFSNTARAHELRKTDDWVVLYVDDGRGERQATIVTETEGALAGRRVIRGREDECAEHHAIASLTPPAQLSA